MKFNRANNEEEAKEIMELQFKHDEDFMFLGSYFTTDNINIIYWQQTDPDGEVTKHLSIVKFDYDLSLLEIERKVINEIATNFIGNNYEITCGKNGLYVVKEMKNFVC